VKSQLGKRECGFEVMRKTGAILGKPLCERCKSEAPVHKRTVPDSFMLIRETLRRNFSGELYFTRCSSFLSSLLANSCNLFDGLLCYASKCLNKFGLRGQRIAVRKGTTVTNYCEKKGWTLLTNLNRTMSRGDIKTPILADGLKVLQIHIST
jgi:hypothetical protein